MVVLPGKTPCLRCLFEEPPAPGELATCDTAGVLGAAAAVVGAMQAAAAIRLIVEGEKGKMRGGGHSGMMLAIDAWAMQFRSVSVADARREECPCCGRRQFDFLNRPMQADVAALCGRNAVQVGRRRDEYGHGDGGAATGDCRYGAEPRCDGAWSLREGAFKLSVFGDGRVIVDGTNDLAVARTLVARYVGM